MKTSSNGNIFRVTSYLCGVFIGHSGIPRTGASDAELWCFLWSEPEWTQIGENIKASRQRPFWGEFTVDRRIPLTKGQWRGKCFHLMTSSSPLLLILRLTYCDLMAPYDDIDLGQHWHSSWLGAWRPQSHYLNQFWLIISEVLWHSPEENLTGNIQCIYLWYQFENNLFKNTAASLRGQWVNSLTRKNAIASVLMFISVPMMKSWNIVSENNKVQ